MPQVSCRMFEMYERGSAELGIPPERLLEGTTLTLDYVRNKRNRAPWDEWVVVCENFEEAVGGPEVMRRWGSRVLDHDYTSIFRKTASFFLSPNHLYRAAVGWMAPVLYPHLEFEIETSGDELVLTCVIPEKHRGGAAWLRLVEGTLVVLPRILGHPDAEVSGEIESHRAVYRVKLPRGPARFRRTRTLLRTALRPAGLLVSLEEVRQDVQDAYQGALASEQEVRALLQALPDPVVVVSGTRIVATNRAWHEGFGLATPDDLAEIASPEERVRALIAGETAEGSKELLLQREDGSTAVCEVSSSSAFHYQGQPVRVLTLRDVTARREEEALIQLAERVSSLGAVAAGVAHDINNPLMVVIAHLEHLGARLRGLPPDDPCRAFIEDVEIATEGAQRVADIARSLVALPRGDDATVASASVDETLEAMLKVAANEIRHRAILVRDYHPVPPVALSPVHLGQVLLNLLINAAQAIPAGRVEENQIILRIELASTSEVRITVQDTGPGIAVEALDSIFDPFHSTKQSTGGLGMGLAICRRTVEQAGGRIEVQSQPGAGARFRVHLPVAEGGEAPGPAPEATEVARPDRPLKIVVVDDEPNLRHILGILLEDHEVKVIAGGREALEFFEKDFEPDLVLCDVMMPDLSGVEVHQAIRERRPELADRFVFMTGGAFGGWIADALEALPNRKVAKPFRPGELESVIAEAAARAP